MWSPMWEDMHACMRGSLSLDESHAMRCATQHAWSHACASRAICICAMRISNEQLTDYGVAPRFEAAASGALRGRVGGGEERAARRDRGEGRAAAAPGVSFDVIRYEVLPEIVSADPVGNALCTRCHRRIENTHTLSRHTTDALGSPVQLCVQLAP